jgi:DNA end-binding protein Ku
MPRAIWSGSISFGLVNIPVQLFPAIHTKEVRFHMLHEKDKVRVRQKLVCPAEKKEIDREDTVKGFQISKDQMVVIEPEELETLKPKSTDTIDIVDFVPLDTIDSLYFRQPYYLVPAKKAAKAYYLLLEAMKKTGRVAVATFVMRNNQYLAALRPLRETICLETMYYEDEITQPDVEGMPPRQAPRPAEMKMAEELVSSLSGRFKPEKYHNDYRDAVMDLVRKKSKGKQIVTDRTREAKGPQIVDLAAALKASLRETKARQKHAA